MERRGIYHRDVSSGNIFTRELKLPPTSEDSAADSYTPCGWLDDFDCTFIGSISSEEDIKHRDALCVCQCAIGRATYGIDFIFDREQCHLCQKQLSSQSGEV